MSEFVTVQEMIDRIKDIACRHYDGKVFDKDVAALWDMNHITLASAKKRNHPPLSSILKFCHRTGIDPMKILF